MTGEVRHLVCRSCDAVYVEWDGYAKHLARHIADYARAVEDRVVVRTAGGWQPVTETSPPGDYEPVLGFCKNAQGINVYRRSIEEANPDSPESTRFFEEWYTGTEELIDDEDYYPTHWMPLPDAPTA